jgi:hypothetical protein
MLPIKNKKNPNFTPTDPSRPCPPQPSTPTVVAQHPEQPRPTRPVAHRPSSFVPSPNLPPVPLSSGAASPNLVPPAAVALLPRGCNRRPQLRLRACNPGAPLVLASTATSGAPAPAPSAVSSTCCASLRRQRMPPGARRGPQIVLGQTRPESRPIGPFVPPCQPGPKTGHRAVLRRNLRHDSTTWHGTKLPSCLIRPGRLVPGHLGLEPG